MHPEDPEHQSTVLCPRLPSFLLIVPACAGAGRLSGFILCYLSEHVFVHEIPVRWELSDYLPVVA